MGVAFYIVLDNDEPGFDTFVNGKCLAREDGLDPLCEELGLKTLNDFFSMSGDEIADMLDEDIELPEVEDQKWFTPDEGLVFVSILSSHLRANPDSVENAAGCLQDLAEYAEVFEQAKAIGAKWHLNIDV